MYSTNSSASFEMNIIFEAMDKLSADKPIRIFQLNGCVCIAKFGSIPIKIKFFWTVWKTSIFGNCDCGSICVEYSIALSFDFSLVWKINLPRPHVNENWIKWFLNIKANCYVEYAQQTIRIVLTNKKLNCTIKILLVLLLFFP